MSPPCRLDAATVADQAAAMAQDAQLAVVVETIPGPAVVLNDRRQIIAANRRFCAVVGVADAASIIGKRPGDAVGCVEASRGSDGCGTAEACKVCGAGLSLTRLEAGEATPITDECRITRQGPHGVESLDLACGINRLPDSGHTLMVLHDISGEKRLRALERVFFHDVLNTAGGLVSLVDLAKSGDQSALELLGGCTEALVEEICQQQVLMAAEHGELVVQLGPEDAGELCRAVAGLYRRHPVADGRAIVCEAVSGRIRTDRVLFRRVLGNLVKNALEASPPGAVVAISGERRGDRLRIQVRNPGMMPEAARLQVFKRSFTTKGVGRGLGTYSVRLFTETYLGGKAGFATDAAAGTVFWVELPAI